MVVIIIISVSLPIASPTDMDPFIRGCFIFHHVGVRVCVCVWVCVCVGVGVGV